MSADSEQLTDSQNGSSEHFSIRHDEPDFDALDPRLRHAVMNQVIPRLKALNRAISDSQAMHRRIGDPAFTGTERAEPSNITEADIAELITMLQGGAASERQLFLEGFVQRGVSFDEICEELIAPAARHLGDCWSADRLSFSEVSSSCSGLQSDLIWLAERVRPDELLHPPSLDAHSVLLFAFPGDRHILAASMLAESFRQAGWVVTLLHPQGVDECLEAARSQHYDLAAISLGRKELLPQLAKAVTQMRAEARNRGIKVMVGGPAIVNSAAAAALGADATSFTGQEAVFQANMLVDEMADRIPNRV